MPFADALNFSHVPVSGVLSAAFRPAELGLKKELGCLTGSQPE